MMVTICKVRYNCFNALTSYRNYHGLECMTIMLGLSLGLYHLFMYSLITFSDGDVQIPSDLRLIFV
jgi:hypothetical protein